MFEVEVTKQHEWLQRLVGEWTHEAEMSAPGQQPEKVTGTETVRSLGGIWIVAEGRWPGGMPEGGEHVSQMTLGYDARKGRFVGTWIGSMMGHLWVYDGDLDNDGRKLTLAAEGPDMSGKGGTAKYRDVIELVSEDHRILTSHTPGEDGVWKQFMEVHFRRQK